MKGGRYRKVIHISHIDSDCPRSGECTKVTIVTEVTLPALGFRVGKTGHHKICSVKGPRVCADICGYVRICALNREKVDSLTPVRSALSGLSLHLFDMLDRCGRLRPGVMFNRGFCSCRMEGSILIERHRNVTGAPWVRDGFSI